MLRLKGRGLPVSTFHAWALDLIERTNSPRSGGDNSARMTDALYIACEGIAACSKGQYAALLIDEAHDLRRVAGRLVRW
jgi:hypothetical protein